MLHLSFTGQIQTGLVYFSLAILPLWYLVPYLLSPLRQFPGPFLAGKLVWTCLNKYLLKPFVFISDT